MYRIDKSDRYYKPNVRYDTLSSKIILLTIFYKDDEPPHDVDDMVLPIYVYGV